MKRIHWFELVFVMVLLGFAGVTVIKAGSDEPTYIGAGKCKPCHFKQYKAWDTTKMSKVFELLSPGVRAEEKKKAGLDPNKDYTDDPKCLKCHTTGYGKPGGFKNLEETPKMVGVQCEMCHGPGSKYSDIKRKNKEYKKEEVLAAGIISPPTIKTCQQCHNTESPFVGDDYVFDFEKRKKEGTHEHFELKYKH